MEYLVGDDTWGHRGGTLYIVAGAFTEQGSFGKRSGLGSAVEDRLDALARLVAETRREGLPEPLALLLSALAVGGVSLWAVSAAMRRYRRLLPRYARPSAPAASCRRTSRSRPR